MVRERGTNDVVPNTGGGQSRQHLAKLTSYKSGDKLAGDSGHALVDGLVEENSPILPVWHSSATGYSAPDI